MAWTAVFLLVMIGMVGLSIDWGKLTWNAQQLQIAADAAALAGAQSLANQSLARDRAQQLARANIADGIGVQIDRNEENVAMGDLVLGRWAKSTRTFTPTLANPNAVKVVARRTADSPDGPVGILFGRMAGINTVDITREAIAVTIPSGGPGILALAPDGVGFQIEGSEATVACDGGIVQVNSGSVPAATLTGKPGREAVVSEEVHVAGEANSRFAGIPNVDLLEGDHPDEDPLKDVPRPGTALGTPGPGVYDTPLTQGTDTTIEPGYYPNGLVLETSQTFTLNPGYYILGKPDGTGGGLIIRGSCHVNALGCQFYVNGSSLVEPKIGVRSVYIAGTGDVRITPPGDNPANYVGGQRVIDGPLGVSLWQADNNLAMAHMAGTGDSSETRGCLYFPHNKVDLAGGNVQVGEQLIADRILLRGTTEAYVEYDGRNGGMTARRAALVR